MTGLTIKELLEHLNRDRQATKALEESELNAEREASLLKTLAFLGQSADLYGVRDREAGLPMDPFRKFIKSQAARLSNRLAGEGSRSEKRILRQRKTNVSLMGKGYIELQKKALGLLAVE